MWRLAPVVEPTSSVAISIFSLRLAEVVDGATGSDVVVVLGVGTGAPVIPRTLTEKGLIKLT